MSDLLTVLEAKSVAKTFSEGDLKVDVLKEVNLTVNASETHAIMGASGSGKSTLMHLLGGLDKPSQGQVIICDQNVNQLSARDVGLVRNKHLGFMYQFHHLLPEFTALENIAMPLFIRGDARDIALETAQKMLADVGLQKRSDHKPGEMSGGERQRIALARSLVTEPDCILADEPTGNLDQKTAAHVMDIMMSLNERIKTALIIVTHDPLMAERMGHHWVLEDSTLKAAS